jgi:hypothetical protein
MLGGSGKIRKSSRADKESPPMVVQFVQEFAAFGFRFGLGRRIKPPFPLDCKSLGKEGIRMVLNDDTFSNGAWIKECEAAGGAQT